MKFSRIIQTILLIGVLTQGTIGSAAEKLGESTATPKLLPVPKDEPTFKVWWEIDIPVMLVGLAFSSGWLLGSTMAPPHCAPLCDPSGLNFLDEGSAGNWDEGWNLASDVVLYSTIATSAGIIGLTESGMAIVKDILIVSEAALLANSFAAITSLATRRPRPHLYGTESPIEERNSPSAAFSYFSGHTGVAFATTVGMFNLLRYRYPDSPWSWIWLGAGTVASSIVATGRVLAGKHFPTDVLMASAVGIGLGFLIPALHRRPDLHLQVLASRQMVGVRWAW